MDPSWCFDLLKHGGLYSELNRFKSGLGARVTYKEVKNTQGGSKNNLQDWLTLTLTDNYVIFIVLLQKQIITFETCGCKFHYWAESIEVLTHGHRGESTANPFIPRYEHSKHTFQTTGWVQMDKITFSSVDTGSFYSSVKLHLFVLDTWRRIHLFMDVQTCAFWNEVLVCVVKGTELKERWVMNPTFPRGTICRILV